jgi:hypothetical protein
MSSQSVTPNPEKDPEDWTTGNEPMTGPQASYLKTLCQEAKVEFDESLTKAEASLKIEELQRMTGRGQPAEDLSTPESDRPSEAAGEDFS